MRDDRPGGLLTIPRAIGPQSLGEPLEVEERLRQPH
jgi:hypothetical protein